VGQGSAGAGPGLHESLVQVERQSQRSAMPPILGLAPGTLCVEATPRGLYVHQMIGILPDKARQVFCIPDGGATVNRPGNRLCRRPKVPAGKPEGTRPSPHAPEKKLSEFVFRRRMGTSSQFRHVSWFEILFMSLTVARPGRQPKESAVAHTSRTALRKWTAFDLLSRGGRPTRRRPPVARLPSPSRMHEPLPDPDYPTAIAWSRPITPASGHSDWPDPERFGLPPLTELPP